MQEELVMQARKGDTESFWKLIDDKFTMLYRIARARLENEEDIGEAINEATLKALKYIKKLKKTEYFQTWLIRILINECNKIYNKNKRHLKLIEKIEMSYDNEVYDYSLNNAESNMDFELLLNYLNYDERIIFVLYFYYEYDTTEIASILHENVNTIKSRFKRGKEKIYKMSKGGVEYDK